MRSRPISSCCRSCRARPYDAVSEEDRAQIITLSFAYIEPRHRFGLLTAELMDKIVEARNKIYAELPADLQGAIERYDPERYATAASLMDNVLFGRIGNQHPDGPDRIREIVRHLLDELGLYDDVLGVGLGFNVGAGGRRLTVAQRQKVDVARTLIKRSDYLIFNRPLSVIDQRVQDHILRNVLEEAKRGDRKPAIIWVLSNPAVAQYFDRVLVFDRGMLVDDGTHETLATKDGFLRNLWRSIRSNGDQDRVGRPCCSRMKWECFGRCRCFRASRRRSSSCWRSRRTGSPTLPARYSSSRAMSATPPMSCFPEPPT